MSSSSTPSARDVEAGSEAPMRTASPQVVRGGPEELQVWPECWGLTLGQCQELLQECQATPGWRSTNTVYDLVEQYVKPKTQGTGLGYALLKNQECPLEVTVMISHAWAENAEDFFATLARSVREEEVLFICALSLYQCGDAAGPSIEEQLGTRVHDSPFYRVLANIRRNGDIAGWSWRWRKVFEFMPMGFFMCFLFLSFFPAGTEVCIPTFDGCAYPTNLNQDSYNYFFDGLCMFPRWVWHYKPMTASSTACLYAAVAAFVLMCGSLVWGRTFLRFNGRMIAVPNHQLDLYSRLWCVYEAYTAVTLGVPVQLGKTLAVAGCCCVAQATCASPDDEIRIRTEIYSASMGSRTGAIVRSLARALPTANLDKATISANFVDTVIRRVTRRAERMMILSLVNWVLPFSAIYLAFGCSQNHWSTFPEKQKKACIGVTSICLTGIIMQVLAFSLAKATRGRPMLYQVGITTGATLLFDATCRVVDYNLQYNHGVLTFWPPLHHCFTFSLACAGVSLALFGLGGRFGFRLRYTNKVAVIAAAVGISFLFIAIFATEHLSIGQVYPTIVWYSCFRLFPMIGFPSLLWMAISSWGVEIAVPAAPAGDSGA